MKPNHLLRMRRSGWFDVLVFFMAIGLILGAMGLAGLLQYNSIQTSMAGATAYEVNQAQTFLSGSHRSYLTLSVIFLSITAVSLLFMRFVSPAFSGSLQAQRFFRRLRVVLQHSAAIMITLVMLFPIYWMIISSLKTSEELLLDVPTLWPVTFQWQNYPDVLSRAPFGLYFFNTIVSTFFIMLGQMGMGVLAAYGFSKGSFKHKNALFLMVLGALMVPIQVTFVPIYVMVSRLNWLNSFPGLVVPNLVSAYFIFMLRQTFMSVDDSYLEAGRIDGMGRIGSIFHVLIPMCKPTLITLSIITFIDGWNSYFWPKMIAPLEKRRTLAVGITQLRRTFAGMETANYNEIMAGAVLAIVPIILLFLILQKYIMTGMSKAAMK